MKKLLPKTTQPPSSLFCKDYGKVYHNSYDSNGEIKDDVLFYDDKDIGCIVKNIKTNYIFTVEKRAEYKDLYDNLGNKYHVDDCIPSNNSEFRKFKINTIFD